ncbi:hypothetical protein [Flavisericum labens]|uniref:hypothetical protein n=1 Tax=Flavisericum labens TaxID=3377112 RepID=UPI00387B9DB2
MKIAKNNQENQSEQKDPNALTVFETGDTRTIDFVLKDGTRQNFAYAHYMTAWIGIDKESENNERYIKIFFATHLVTINGYCLDEIYNSLISFSLKSVKVIDDRYLDMAGDDESFVKDITITWKKEEGKSIEN